MAIIFNLDGTTTFFEDEVDEQKELEERILCYTQHVEDAYTELRTYRDQELKDSDWTQVSDNALGSSAKTAWANYRTALRALPNDNKAPFGFQASDWPVAPGASSPNAEALRFIEHNEDPLGIATTSWVGTTTSMVNKVSVESSSASDAGIGTDIVGVADTTGILVGDHLVKGDVLLGIISGITTVSVSLASTIPSEVERTTILCIQRVGDIYYQQDKPTITYAVSAGATTVVAGAAISFTTTITNQVSPESVQWETSNAVVSAGTLEITPINTTGIGTVTVDVPSGIGPSDLRFTLLHKMGLRTTPNRISMSVGVTTA